METQTINKGDVYYTSWGYDQTNYDYVVVESISPTGKTAVCRLAKVKDMGVSGQCNMQKPINEGYGPEFRLRIEKDSNGEYQLRGSYPYCYNEENPTGTGYRLSTLWKVKEDKVFYETDSMYGH